MTANDDKAISELIRQSGVGPFLRLLETDGRVTWAKFKGNPEYVRVEATWDVNSTVESVADSIIAQAQELIGQR